MSKHVVLVAGHNAGDRLTVARTVAAENQWAILDIDELTAELRGATPLVRTSSVLSVAFAQAEAGVSGVVVSAPLADELASTDWLDEVGYDFDLLGYDTTVVYCLAEGEEDPGLDPEHFVIDAFADLDDMLTAATCHAIEIRQS